MSKMPNQIERKPPPQKTPFNIGNPYLDNLMKQSGTTLPPRNMNASPNANSVGRQGIVNSQINPQANPAFNNPNQMINSALNLGQSQFQNNQNQNLNQSPEFKNQINQPNSGILPQSPPVLNSTASYTNTTYEEKVKNIQSNIQGLVNQLNSLQENLLYARNNNYTNPQVNVSKNSPSLSNIIKGDLVNDITPNISRKPDPIPSYPPYLNTSFPTFPQIIEHPLFPPANINFQNDKSFPNANPALSYENSSRINNSNMLSSMENEGGAINQIPFPDPTKIKILEAVYQPLEKVIQTTQAGIEAIKNQLSYIASQKQNIYPSPIKTIHPSNSMVNEYILSSKNILSSYNDAFTIHPLWQQKIKENITLDPSNEEKVINHLHELIIDPIQMSELIDSIFLTLNNDSNLFSSIEFKEFYDLTSSGMNAPQLDITYIMNEFLSIPKADPKGISKIELKSYVTKMYQSIILFAQNYINFPK